MGEARPRVHRQLESLARPPHHAEDAAGGARRHGREVTSAALLTLSLVGSLGLVKKRAPVVEPLLDPLLHALVARLVIATSLRKIGLGHIVTLVVVTVFVSLVAKGLLGLAMIAIPEVAWHGQGDARLYFR